MGSFNNHPISNNNMRIHNTLPIYESAIIDPCTPVECQMIDKSGRCTYKCIDYKCINYKLTLKRANIYLPYYSLEIIKGRKRIKIVDERTSNFLSFICNEIEEQLGLKFTNKYDYIKFNSTENELCITDRICLSKLKCFTISNI